MMHYGKTTNIDNHEQIWGLSLKRREQPIDVHKSNSHKRVWGIDIRVLQGAPSGARAQESSRLSTDCEKKDYISRPRKSSPGFPLTHKSRSDPVHYPLEDSIRFLQPVAPFSHSLSSFLSLFMSKFTVALLMFGHAYAVVPAIEQTEPSENHSLECGAENPLIAILQSSAEFISSNPMSLTDVRRAVHDAEKSEAIVSNAIKAVSQLLPFISSSAHANPEDVQELYLDLYDYLGSNESISDFVNVHSGRPQAALEALNRFKSELRSHINDLEFHIAKKVRVHAERRRKSLRIKAQLLDDFTHCIEELWAQRSAGQDLDRDARIETIEAIIDQIS